VFKLLWAEIWNNREPKLKLWRGTDSLKVAEERTDLVDQDVNKVRRIYSGNFNRTRHTIGSKWGFSSKAKEKDR